MKRIYQKTLAGTLAAVMLATSACTVSPSQETTISQLEQEEPAQPKGNLRKGDAVAGFTVDTISDSRMLQAQLIGFTHEKSGAELVWVKNSDPELAFAINYHTPYIDETDTNHVFEHAIIASSEKYPSNNLFFDLIGKSYNTFINAFTYDTFTSYPVSSESEEQLIKLMDAYLSCMVAPDILKNENIFKREAIRYELDSPEDEIRMIGTVYSEDFGFLTDMSHEAANHIRDALYPGQYASNYIGRSHRNYQDLTYEATLDTYQRYYHFDNSLIFLYGDMDYERILSFIDKEYLSKAEKQETGLFAYTDPPSKNGYEEKTVSVPAFEGDQTENVSQIDYAFSLEDKKWEDLTAWIVLTNVLNHENSSFHKNLKAQGIQNQAQVYVDLYSAKPYLQFSLLNGDPGQSQTFKTAVTKTLTQTAEKGVDEEILHSILKQAETSGYLLRDDMNVGINVFPDMVNYWTHTGNYDFYNLFEQTLRNLEADGEQEIFRRLAEEACSSIRSALVTNVPEPGLAEKIIGEQDAYLVNMKASMTEEELMEMIRDTKEFRAWNETKVSNSDFMIDPADIPDEEPFTGYQKENGDGVTYYTAPAEVEQVGKYRLYLDISDFSEEEQMDLGLFGILAGQMATKEHTLEEILNLKSEYLYSYSMECLYPDGENAYPMFMLSWITLTEDYETGLDLLLEILGSTDVANTERILELLVREADFYDLSRTDDKLSLARDLAASYIYRDYAYEEAYRGQKFYYYLDEIKNRLNEDISYGEALSKRLRSISEKLMKKGRMIFAGAAPEADLERIRTASREILEALPAKEGQESVVALPAKAQKRAVALESSDQYSVIVGNCYENSEFSGKYIPFMLAASDLYIVPKLRFQMGAYSGGVSFSADNGGLIMYSYSDPNASETLKVFEGTADAITEMELTQKELDGYILTAVSSSIISRGVLAQPLDAMENEIIGWDTKKACQVINDMKNASLQDQKEAAECIRKIIEQSGIATVGNETKLKAAQGTYDQFLSYKSKEKQE